MEMPKHIIFDAYGTLFDLSAALAPAVILLGDDANDVLARWRTLQLEYAWLSALSNRYTNFEIATRNAFRDALAEKDIEDETLVDVLLDGFRNVSPYPDAVQTLDLLKQKGMTTAILSNGTPSILETAARSAGLDMFLDRVLSVDEVRNYKPAPEAYCIATDAFNIDPKHVFFISSNWWDVDGAHAFGYKTIWIDRGTYSWPPSIPYPERVVDSLIKLNELIN